MSVVVVNAFTGIPEDVVHDIEKTVPASSGEMNTYSQLISTDDHVDTPSMVAIAWDTRSKEVGSKKPSKLAGRKFSLRRELLKQRTTTLSEYFAPLIRKPTQTEPTGVEDVVVDINNDDNAKGEPVSVVGSFDDTFIPGNDAMLSTRDSIPINASASSVTETTHESQTDEVAQPQKNHNLLKAAKRKFRTIFQKDHMSPSCACLDEYKSIAEDDLKPVINRDFKPLCLGFGSYGVVDLMTLAQGDDEEILVAVKSFPYDDSFSRKKKKQINKSIAMELKFMDRMKDIEEFPDVLGVCKNANGYHIVMEFIGDEQSIRSMSLTEAFLQEYEDGFPHKSKKIDLIWLEVLLDTIKAIHKMHVRGVIHCDIAPRNVLLYENGQRRISGKLIDFGLACNEEKPSWLSLCRCKSKTAARKILESNICHAPEFGKGTWWSRGGYHSKASDVWAFGQMFTGISELLTAQTDANVQRLVAECTAVDPRCRPTSKHIISELESAILRIRLDNLGCRESTLL